MSRSRHARPGLTAVELLAATMLASLLMLALMGTLRGLKAQTRAVDLRTPALPWERSLDAVLQNDLVSAQAYVASNRRLVLQGVAAEDWSPAGVVYEVTEIGGRPWLIRRLLPGPDAAKPPPLNLVLADVGSLRINGRAQPNKTGVEPIRAELLIELLGTDPAEPVYAYRHSYE